MGQYLVVVLALTFSIASKADGLKFSKCEHWQKNTLLEAYETSVRRVDNMIAEVKSLDMRSVDKKTKSKMDKALSKLECIKRKLPNSHYKCSSKHNDSAIARTIPILGNGVKIFMGYYDQRPMFRASTLSHEASHKCNTSDRVYYYHKNINPSDDADSKWYGVAGFYDWWFMRGVCIPGYTC